jgi:hypothetical protein
MPAPDTGEPPDAQDGYRDFERIDDFWNRFRAWGSLLPAWCVVVG